VDTVGKATGGADPRKARSGAVAPCQAARVPSDAPATVPSKFWRKMNIASAWRQLPRDGRMHTINSA
jgi:hypothetical protein